ncbi:MAG: hypothetical protein H7288_14950 [Kineosporiaceae bacterium]|nr:hypothetical protein [Aeromicrobium sp.]
MTEPHVPRSNLPPYPGPPAAPHGSPSYESGFSLQGNPNVRPGTVTAAAWITIGLSVIGLLGSLALMSVTSRAVDYVIEHPNEFDVKSSDLPAAADLRSVLGGIAVVLVVASALAIVAAIGTLKRRAWGRISLVVLSAFTALISIPLSLGLIGLPWLGGSIAVIVLLFTNRANTWFRSSEA